MKQQYQPYEPNKWERRIDSLFGLVSTKAALGRMVNREKLHYFRYLSAYPSSARQNAMPSTAGEWLKIQREKMQVMWNAVDMVDNSGLCSGILIKFPTYVCGTLRWQAKTGDKTINTMYQDYIAQKTNKPGNIDIKGMHSLRTMCMLDVKSIALKGDVGTNIVREDNELYLQGIEANRIGDPYKWITSDTYVRGLNIDRRTGRIVSARVYHQDRRDGLYKFDDTFQMRDERGLPKFLFFTNPLSFDDYRGVSLFKHAIDNATYIDRMRNYELQALLWAASQSGVYYTKSGALPEQLPFSRTPAQDRDGNTIDTFEARPNTIVALSSEGEKVEMFHHDRPSPNVIGMYENTVREIAIGAGLTYGFAYDMTGVTGPAVRQCSAQDARAIAIWQEMLREQKLDPVIMLLLGDAIARGDLPYHQNWLKWDWFFPAKPTIDVGRESAASIEEMQAGINTGAKIAADSGDGDIEEIITQRSHEVEMAIDAAQKIAQSKGLQWQEVYALMIPPPRGSGQRGMAASAGMAADMANQNGDQPGATDNGVDLNGEGGGEPNEFSLKKKEDSCFVIETDDTIFEFYNPAQLRDEGGRFGDEGKGAGQPGYKHPDEAGLTGIDRRLVDYVKRRPLTRQNKDVRSIGKYIPGIHCINYSKTPFFKRLNELQGTPDPDKVDIEDFTAARKKFFKDQPVERLKIDDLVATQPVVNKAKVKKNVKEGKEKSLFVVDYGGKYYVMDGHHALAAAAKRGETKIDAHVASISNAPNITQEFDAESGKTQERDQGGRFGDEGKGSQQTGYKHPGDQQAAGGSQTGGRGRLQLPAPRHRAAEFYSPNRGAMGFTQAQAALNGSRQDVALDVSLDVDKQLGNYSADNVKYEDAIGDWQDGAENGVIAEYNQVDSFDDLRYNAAVKGKLLHQKAVLAFQEDSNAQDALYNVYLPFGESEPGGGMEAIRARLDLAGLKYRTLTPEYKGGNGARITLFAQGEEGNKAMVDGLAKFHKIYQDQGNELKIEKITGKGEFVGEPTEEQQQQTPVGGKAGEPHGDASERYFAKQNYDAIIDNYEKAFPDKRHYQFDSAAPGVRDNGSQVGSSPTTSKPDRLAVKGTLGTLDISNVDSEEGGWNTGHSTDVDFVTFVDGRKGVFKPVDGERVDLRPGRIKRGSYYQREAAASEVAEVIGMDDLVPATVIRDVNGKQGSMQEFINGESAKSVDYTQKYDGDKDLARAAAFDYLIWNTDRHAGNWMVKGGGVQSDNVTVTDPGQLALIDNGLSFSARDDGGFANHDIYDRAYNRQLDVPDEARHWVDKLPEIMGVMKQHGFSPDEMDGVTRRANSLASAASFGDLGGWNDDELNDEPDPDNDSNERLTLSGDRTSSAPSFDSNQYPLNSSGRNFVGAGQIVGSDGGVKPRIAPFSGSKTNAIPDEQKAYDKHLADHFGKAVKEVGRAGHQPLFDWTDVSGKKVSSSESDSRVGNILGRRMGAGQREGRVIHEVVNSHEQKGNMPTQQEIDGDKPVINASEYVDSKGDIHKRDWTGGVRTQHEKVYDEFLANQHGKGVVHIGKKYHYIEAEKRNAIAKGDAISAIKT